MHAQAKPHAQAFPAYPSVSLGDVIVEQLAALALLTPQLIPVVLIPT